MVALFFVIFFKQLFWSLLVPLWHFPDEQAHFGHIAYLAEGDNLSLHGRRDQNEEVVISEEILGTKRDLQGNNKFTFNPQYRLEYSDNLDGPREQEINALPITTRKNFVLAESAYYPHFFYYLSGFIYKLFYYANLFIRVFSIRLFWISGYLLMIWLVYQSSRIVFASKAIALIVSTITAFQPMLSFVASGITSDNLYNLLFTAVIYFCLRLLTQYRWQDLIVLGLIFAFGIITKQQFLTAFIVIGPVILILMIKKTKSFFKVFIPALFLSLIVTTCLAPDYVTKIFTSLARHELPFIKFTQLKNPVRLDYNLLEHSIWTIRHTIKEVLPWYWGVFNWLGVVLPRWVNRVLMRILVIAGLGLIIKVIKIIKNRHLRQQDRLLGFMAWVALTYYLCLLVWDWTFVRKNGFSFGLQGRYYFPVILSHMILLTAGIKAFFGLFGKKICRLSLLALGLWFICLNFIALYTVAQAYYNVSSFQTFIIQASQYKPFFAKGAWLVGVFSAFLVSCSLFIVKLIQWRKNY